jgi:hygromycin-B 4-O-kinase
VLEPTSGVQLPQAQTFLAERFGIDDAAVEYVGEGAWSRCFAFSHNGGELVARFGRHLDDFQRDRIASRFAARALPIPQVIEIDEAFDGWYCVSTRARGTPLEQLEQGEWNLTAPSVLAMLDALRTTDISATVGHGEWNAEGMAPHGTWRDFLAAVDRDQPGSRFHGWKQRLAKSALGLASFERAYQQMLELADAFVGQRSLVHNDLLNRNVLAADGQVTGVFDWGCAIYGDFVYELATFVFWSPWHVAIEQSDLVSMALDHYADMGLDVPNFDARLRCCALHIGLVHLAYNAFLGDDENLRLTDERMRHFLQ